MLADPWPASALFALRHALFLAPLTAVVLLMLRRRKRPRMIVGALFSFLYALPLLFIDHVLAIHFGAWHYGGSSLKMLGFPADIWFAGALLGPALYLTLPTVPPWLLAAFLVGLNGLLLPVFTPFVTIGPNWFAAVIVVFLTTHLPALYLARWTDRDQYLPRRAFLLAVGFAGMAFFLIPTVIMHAMGGSWGVLHQRPGWALALAAACLAPPAVLGLTAVQMFVLYGEGTPIPLDPTKRLVREGIYAHVCNPMQLSTALAFGILGIVLGNVWVSLAAAMAVIFVLGMVRWHHRNDLEVRFPKGWTVYRSNVREWMPRWRPWVPKPARLTYDPSDFWQLRAAAALRRAGCVGLAVEAQPGRLRYADAREFCGVAALAQAMSHCNLIVALAGAAILLVLLPLSYLSSAARDVRHG